MPFALILKLCLYFHLAFLKKSKKLCFIKLADIKEVYKSFDSINHFLLQLKEKKQEDSACFNHCLHTFERMNTNVTELLATLEKQNREGVLTA